MSQWSEEALKSIEKMKAEGRLIDKTPRPVIAVPETEFEAEKNFQAAVEKEFRSQGWKVYHTRDSRKSEKGFPDVIALRAGYMIVAELKVDGNKPTAEQETWLELFRELAEATGLRIIVRLWYPRHWGEIVAMSIDPAAVRNTAP